MSHTAGDWTVSTGSGAKYGAVISTVGPRAARPDDPLEIDAYGGYLIAESIAPQDRALIAAAPALLAALTDIASIVVSGDDCPKDCDCGAESPIEEHEQTTDEMIDMMHEAVDIARAAIAKATGDGL